MVSYWLYSYAARLTLWSHMMQVMLCYMVWCSKYFALQQHMYWPITEQGKKAIITNLLLWQATPYKLSWWMKLGSTIFNLNISGNDFVCVCVCVSKRDLTHHPTTRYRAKNRLHKRCDTQRGIHIHTGNWKGKCIYSTMRKLLCLFQCCTRKCSLYYGENILVNF
jgi:hypothetical protein